MKPLIIYIDGERDEIRLSRKQFEKFIQDAYQQGYDSGYQVGYRSTYYWPYWTGTDPNAFKPSVTCASYTGEQCINTTMDSEAHNSIGD